MHDSIDEHAQLAIGTDTANELNFINEMPLGDTHDVNTMQIKSTHKAVFDT